MSECEICCLPCVAIIGCIGLCLTASRGPSHPCARGCFSCCGSCCRESKSRDMDQFVSEVEREMVEERARQQALVQQQPESGPSMSLPRSGLSTEEERRKSKSRENRDRTDRHQKTNDKVEKWRRRYDHEEAEYPPNPYPESSAALGRSKSDQRLHPSERSSRHMRETRSADFRQSAIEHDSSMPGSNNANYPPSPYPREPEGKPFPEPSREGQHEHYDSESADRRSRALLSPVTKPPTDRVPQRERTNSQRRTNKYPPMPNVPVVYATRTRSREERIDIPPS